MGGAIAVLMLGTIFAWMVGCIPYYAILTLVRPGLFWLFRILLALFLSAVIVVVLWWASIEFRTPWIFGLYTVFMAIATVASTVLLIVRWFVRRG